MKRLRILFIIIFVGIVISTTIYIELFPFGYRAKEILADATRLDVYNVNNDIPNTSIYSYKVKEKFNNKIDFIKFLKKHQAKEDSDMYSLEFDLGSFKDNNGNVMWEEVYNSLKVTYKLWKKIYSLEYKTSHVECNGNNLSITKNGYVLDYRSAGK